ncbi:pyridoxal phosphate-dependent aminotransferase [Abyssisolibacter fermentans]|uniref:pyridoxal phosphate-dependent aminotransferase n=1 Tax=Abyssisolibacter fermentans TaxID=1766203 RepID=UPI00082D7602|nr:pyridoxal phosphate-dependent aminotransferase [Abyssisolibacter fermentans]
MKLSERLSSINPSLTLAISAKAKELKASGVDVISFGAGEPDFNAPENIQDEAISSIREGKIKYTAASGLVELKKAICNKLLRDNNISYEPKNIIISNGAKQCLYNSLCAILNDGDEVIIAAPYWVSYYELIMLAGGKPVVIETKEENDFKYTMQGLRDALTNKTKAIIINTPNNPTGTVYNKEELESIGNWAVDNDLFIISDEIYEKLIYDGNEHYSIAGLNDKFKDNTIVINGMSKAYAMTGWRVGYAAAHEDIIKLMNNFQSHATSNACTISQYASIEGLNGDQSKIEVMRKAFDERRKYMVSAINDVKSLSCRKPLGAFYVMVNISQLKGKTINGKKIETSLDFCNVLLDEAKVAVIPGSAFGTDDYIRLSYATSLDNIKNGIQRIKELVEANI